MPSSAEIDAILAARFAAYLPTKVAVPTITDAQIKAGGNVNLIAGVAGKILMPSLGGGLLHYAAQYLSEGAPLASIRVDIPTGSFRFAFAFANQPDAVSTQFNGVTSTAELQTLVGLPLVAVFTTAGAVYPLTGGDAANYLKFVIPYVEMDLTIA